MELIEGFKMLRDACDAVIVALESDDEAALEAALGKFLLAAAKMDALK